MGNVFTLQCSVGVIYYQRPTHESMFAALLTDCFCFESNTKVVKKAICPKNNALLSTHNHLQAHAHCASASLSSCSSTQQVITFVLSQV